MRLLFGCVGEGNRALAWGRRYVWTVGVTARYGSPSSTPMVIGKATVEIWCEIFCLQETWLSTGRGGRVTKEELAEGRCRVKPRLLILYLATVPLRLRLSRMVALPPSEKQRWRLDWANGSA